jgi:hypothetical protein
MLAHESMGVPRLKGFALTKWDGEPPLPGERKAPVEAIIGAVDEVTQELIRPVYFRNVGNEGDEGMIRVKAPFSINNGFETAEANEVISVSPDQAKKILKLGGDLVTKEGEVVPLAQAVNIVRLQLDELPAEDARDARAQELAAAIAA